MDSISVPMTCGLSFKIDIADYVREHEIEFACGYRLTIVPSRFRWMVMKTHTGYVYNRIDRPKGRRFTVYLHRLLCGPTAEAAGGVTCRNLRASGADEVYTWQPIAVVADGPTAKQRVLFAD